MHPFDDKQKFASEGEPESSRPQESPDEDIEELSEEELAAEMEPFTLPQWKQEFPDYTAEELEEKIPESARASRMALVESCLMGTVLGAAIAGVLVNNLPRSQQSRGFFIYFLVIALLLSLAWHWLFYLRPNRLKKKLRDQQTDSHVPGESVTNEMNEQETQYSPGPIHPK